ncbi:aldehyde dehydrogenase [Rhodopseudomonas sp. AAP120]|uniref:xanthine dehydrogenase family protein molybdopterin-binding subunit n=1 Tax=Rhodopseudomonas sp. AAP120 TaxID=1523430 RepID=UPI0006B8C857|nr:molybdopterin cofactor-binding domain-containing protein [Rhodopseudomonas sp. AAP120]KPF96356.1 aldehyde dehydrogenase [Rhodopseudomonas sp. AAP120]
MTASHESRSQARGPSRRAFLAGALVIAFVRPGKAHAAPLEAGPASSPAQLGGFVRIAPSGEITLVMPSVEMGQGIYTAEAALLAEELDVRLDQITAVAAPPDVALYAQPLFKAQLTGGSTSIRGFWTPLRQAGAAARQMLVAAAAQRWQVDAADCVTRDGTITHTPSGRSLPYAEVAAEAALLPIPTQPRLKAPADYKLIGKSLKRIDTPGKVDGSAIYGIDIDVPGMKTAVLAICPVAGGTLRAMDDTKARRLPGVIDVLRIDDAVAVVGEHYWAAKTGCDALDLDWDYGANATLSSEGIRQDAKAASTSVTPIEALKHGDVDAAFAQAKRRIDAEYEMPFLAHATMEPINTTVHVRPDGCDIWVGTQTPAVAQRHAAQIIGLPVEKVAVHNQLIGGGFGRRLQADTIEQAVRFAKQVPYPLKVIWTREQDIRHDRFRPYYYDRFSAGLDENGLPVAWTHRTTSGTVRKDFDDNGWPQGKLDKDAVDGSWDSPYAFPNIRVDWVRHDPPIRLNWWRGVGPTHNVFVLESFVDELAHSVGRDPIDYRRALLPADNVRARHVLDLATEKANWGAPQGGRIGRGVSLHQNFGSFSALVVEVAVAASGEVTLRKAVAAVDCGTLINPDIVRAQIEGGVLFGLSAALFNGITFANGRVQQSNFNDYRQLRINETPSVEVHLVDSREPPGGLGEVGTVSAAPALANAIFAATGVRLRRLPIDKAALKARDAT